MPHIAAHRSIPLTSVSTSSQAVLAWLVAALYFFYQYSLRSSPSVMIPNLASSFGIDALAVASISGLFYYGYAPFNLVAGAAVDEFGPRRVLPVSAVVVGMGAIVFAAGGSTAACAGRLLQGAGAAFAAVGAIFAATNYFPASRAATLVGATQMFGMAGGAAGQFAVGPVVDTGLPWRRLWIGMGVAGLGLGVLLAFLLPKKEIPVRKNWLNLAAKAAFTVLKNPQSILCGLIAGLLFLPTTIFAMVWGIQYLQEARGFDYGIAVMRSAAVPVGWIIGCPLLGYVSDRLGRRKPVLIAGALLLLACLAWILFGPVAIFPPYTLALLAGIASGAAMLPYLVIKEVNPAGLAGTATGVLNFINFTFSAMLAPVFATLLHDVSQGSSRRTLTHYQWAFGPMLAGVCVAIALALLLKETGPALQAGAGT